ncbi:MAG: hypothetical protein LBH43_07960 [Treponema sp.]|jgi:hypothetical protein|nr:hypothetical protein [Treponema sp.]
MKKWLTVAIFLLAAGAVFGQDFTFQGLPWGSTREQIIAKLGQPANSSSGYLIYFVTISGYKARLHIDLDNDGMGYSSYTIGVFRDLNASQIKIAFLTLLRQLEEKYGPYNELITADDLKSIQRNESLIIWHFNNFHIMVSPVENDSTFEITYWSDTIWNIFEEENIKAYKTLRIPNNGL